MQYSVPQFVDVEDKVIGPLSIKQFLWLLGGAGIGVVLWLILPTILAIILIIPDFLLAAGFAFYKVNGVPLQIYIANLIGFVLRPNTRVWKREVELDKTITKMDSGKQEKKPNKIHLRDVNLDQLTYILDHELSAQAKARPITNNVEALPVPQAQVVMKQDVAIENMNALSGQAFVGMPQQQPTTPEPVEATSSLSSANPNVVTSIKPFRTNH